MTDQKDNAYKERNLCVSLIAKMAHKMGLPVGIQLSPNEGEPDWHIIFIELPSGQVSWHFHSNEIPHFTGYPDYKKKWDGHNWDEKYKRVKSPGF
jgi:hypothetical protein